MADEPIDRWTWADWPFHWYLWTLYQVTPSKPCPWFLLILVIFDLFLALCYWPFFSSLTWTKSYWWTTKRWRISTIGCTSKTEVSATPFSSYYIHSSSGTGFFKPSINLTSVMCIIHRVMGILEFISGGYQGCGASLPTHTIDNLKISLKPVLRKQLENPE